MKKKNRVFAVIISVLFIGVLIYAPIHAILMNAGVIEYENVGNIIEVEKVYDESHPLAVPLNAIEEGKRTLIDTYTNHIPFYLEVTTFARSLKRAINEPLTKWLQSVGDRIIRDKLKKK